MVCMANMSGEHELNAAIPERLWEELDELVPQFRPHKKKHLVTAALAAFIKMDDAAQRDAILHALDSYYGKMRATKGPSKENLNTKNVRGTRRK